MDVIISEVRTKSGLSFSVQILNTEGNHRMRYAKESTDMIVICRDEVYIKDVFIMYL